jgi:2-methylcitrate dehydratase PrpD
VTSSAPGLGEDRLATRFAEWAAELTWDRMPVRTRTIAARELLDLMGDMAAGRGLLGMPPCLNAVLDAAGGGRARFIGGGTTSPAAAALVNGYFAHALELDDTHDEAVLHAGTPVIAAALAAADHRGGVSGKELLTALVIGIELVCRLGVATKLNLVEGGWIYSALLGHFGAATAAAKLLADDVNVLRSALGVAYSFTSGNHQPTREGAETKHLQPAIAGSNGFTAALMAASGLRGVRQPFLGEDGLSRVHLRNRLEADRALQDLGDAFEIERLSFKPYPSCRLTHPAVTAALELHRRLGP